MSITSQKPRGLLKEMLMDGIWNSAYSTFQSVHCMVSAVD